MIDVLQTVYDSRVLRLSLNRPEKRNALDFELRRSTLVDALGCIVKDSLKNPGGYMLQKANLLL
jgi:enoyl-CoA hydratase/carnithine racemase